MECSSSLTSWCEWRRVYPMMYIICITQVKFINNALLVNYWRLQFSLFQVINDLLARKDWLQFMIDFLFQGLEVVCEPHQRISDIYKA